MDGNGDFQPTISYIKILLHHPIEKARFGLYGRAGGEWMDWALFTKWLISMVILSPLQ